MVDDWGYGYIDIRNPYRFFKNNRSKATEEDCQAIIRWLDLDADSKLSKEEFLQGIKAQEPFSKMIVREKMAKREEIDKQKSLQNNEKTKKTTRKGEETIIENWNQQHTLNTRAMDREFKNIKSVSPLKHRVDLDVEPSPSRLVMLETLRQSSPYRSRSKGRTNGATLPLTMQNND